MRLRKAAKQLKKGVKRAMMRSTKTRKQLEAKQKMLSGLTSTGRMMNSSIKKLQTKIQDDLGKVAPKSWAKFKPTIEKFKGARKAFYTMRETWIANSQLKFYTMRETWIANS